MGGIRHAILPGSPGIRSGGVWCGQGLTGMVGRLWQVGMVHRPLSIWSGTGCGRVAVFGPVGGGRVGGCVCSW